ncbi:hypothetical protein, partial, partial [Parasitella parasitica]
MGVVNIEIKLLNKKPKKIKVNGARKTKQPQPKKEVSKDQIGLEQAKLKHLLAGSLINKELPYNNTMDLMEQYPDMKGFYIVMDNAPIHTADDIDEMIPKGGYKSINLSTYSPELNPIENFGSTMNSYLKRSKFSGDKDPKTRRAESSNG